MIRYTPRQLECMRFIHSYQVEHGCSPILLDIGKAMGVNPVTVHECVHALKRKGALEIVPFATRGITILDTDFNGDTTVRVLFDLMRAIGNRGLVVRLPVDIVIRADEELRKAGLIQETP